MTTTISGSGTDRTFTYEQTRPTAKIQGVLDSAAHYLFNHGYGDHGTEEVPRTYADQTTNEKLDMLDKHITRVLMDAADSFHVNDAIEVARLAAIESADFDLGQGLL